MNDCDDLNFYYKKFLNKLSKICLKIFLPLLLLINIFTLLFCRLFLSNHIFDIHTKIYLILIVVTCILLLFIRIHSKRKKIWIFTRFLIIFLLIIPLILTYQTEQFHILLSSISIILLYSLLTFTLLQSLLISLSISILHLILILNLKTNPIQWKSLEFFTIIFYHLIINLTGLYSYISSIQHIREHFYAYKTNLFEKNKYNLDCKKLHTIIGYCQKSPTILNTNSLSKFGTVINCSISLNEQTRIHTCDELASLIDVLYCQIEQLILQIQPDAYYLFDNETILISLLNENNNEQLNIENSCHLAIELYRFIQHVNNITQWNLTLIIGIDYNQINILSSRYIEGLAYDYSRWLRDECVVKDRIHVSNKIYEILKENSLYKFSVITNNLTYLLFHTNMYESFNNGLILVNTSNMIDQLTRIQAEYYVEKHLGTITLSRTLRKRSLFELTSEYIHWFNLNFREKYLTKDFQTLHRTNRPKNFIYVFILLILIGSLLQSLIINHLNFYYLILFPLIIIGLIILIIIFYYLIRTENSDINRKFYVYLNILICLTLTTLIFVAIQYHSIQNFKYLFISNNPLNITILSATLNNTTSTEIKPIHSEPISSFDRQYHEYLVLSPIYPLYFCTLFRQCSWIIKTFCIICCSFLQLYILEYIWLTTNTYFLSINTLHHYTTFTLIIFHNILLIILSYIYEWFEKIDFIWLKQIDNERLMIIRQRNQLIKQISSILPLRVINYYLNTNWNLSLTQHYHYKYDRMGLLYIRFNSSNNKDEYCLIHCINNIEYLLRTNEKYLNIVMHKKSTTKELIFSLDLNNSSKSIQQLVELLFQIDEYIKSYQINLTACLHIGSIHEILIHFIKYPLIDIWSEHILFIQLLISKIQLNHCLVTSTVYHLLNDLYLFRTAGSIIDTQINIENNTNIYFLLGRLIGDNVFQGRNTLPLIINQPNNDTIPKSSSTDESHFSQNDKNFSITTTTTTSSDIINDQQSLLKQSTRKHVRISNQNSFQTSYRDTLLQALSPPTNNSHQTGPVKKITNLIYSGDNNGWSSKEVSINESKSLMSTTQKIRHEQTDDNNLSKSVSASSNHPMSSKRKSCMNDNIQPLVHDRSSKDVTNPSHSISTPNEETTSSFSGWDDPPSSSLPINHETKQQESIKQTITNSSNVDNHYPSQPYDISFTVNMTTSDIKSNIPQQQQISSFRPLLPFNLAHKLIAETSESEISVHHEPWTRNTVYQSKNLPRTCFSSSYNNLSNIRSKQRRPPTLCHPDLLQRWLEDQLNQFRSHIKQTPPPLTKKFHQYTTTENDSSDNESDTLHENTFPILNTKSKKRPYNHIRYKSLRKNTQLVRHESLNDRNRSVINENNPPKNKFPKRTDSSSIPASDQSDVSSSRPDHLSEGVLSNFESEYDNMYTQNLNSNEKTKIVNKSQIITDNDDDNIDNNDSDDETTLATTINRCYF
ncbi:unnamed protein product [Adineta steineri]|uniref:Uncharacterized protein n=1 Tax=Adineta steineri TaxID=433720 RepID=A0A814RCJ2_9BILA|nr:unnamed protein product [Adineta steineri]